MNTPLQKYSSLIVALVSMVAPTLGVAFHIQIDPKKLGALVVAYVLPAVTYIIAHHATLARDLKAAALAAVEPDPLPTVAPAIPPVVAGKVEVKP